MPLRNSDDARGENTPLDVHWYELGGVHYEEKTKGVKQK